MASVDLVFFAVPLTKGNLVFGDDGSPPISNAVISGTISLERPTLSGRVELAVDVSGTVVLARPTLQGEVKYVSDTQRPLAAVTRVRWQDGEDREMVSTARYQGARPLPLAAQSRYQDGQPLFSGATVGWLDADRTARRDVNTRYQDGTPRRRGVRTRFQEALRTPNVQHVRYQDGKPVRRAWWFRYQEALRVPNTQQMRYQDANPLAVVVRAPNYTALKLSLGWRTRYQDGVQPRPGRTILIPVIPPEEPCYTPNGDLVFEAPWSADTNLVFFCENHGPGPEPGETVVVPVRRIYTVINSATLRRLDGDVLIPTLAMTLTIDVDSWTWGFTARTPGSALSDLEPGAGGQPVEVEARINGVPYRALVEGITRERVFGRSDLSVTGRGKAAVLDAPYTPLSTFGNPLAARTAQQLANDVLTLNGVSLGWAVNWAPEDWLVPAGVFSHQGSYMTALNAIAGAAGAYIQPHRTAKSLEFLLRYPAKPWEWGDVTPDYELPADVVQKEGIAWSDKAAYNRVFVRGVQAGVVGQVTRGGTAGDLEAPMVTDPLITTAVAARQRGLPVLADVGRQAAVSLRLPVLAETGIIPPGKFVRYVDGGVTRIGLVRSTSAAIERAEDKLTIWQTIGVETHVGV